MNNPPDIEMAQTSKQRRDSIKKAVAAKHAADKATKNRCDIYIEDKTHEGLKRIKNEFDEVKNKDQAVDKAVEIALEKMDEDK